jgi:hypothetical protein
LHWLLCMSKDVRQALRTLLLWLLVGPGILAGTAVTWGAAWVGLKIASSPPIWGYTCRYPKLSTAKMRVKAARDAATQFMIETPSWPHSIEELVSGKYLDEANSKDPWGSELELTCPGNNDTSGADVRSLGPDKQPGTADDVNSWEL